ncbi:MAG: DUF3089 domain-containing protein [Sphingosinicella sp.]
MAERRRSSPAVRFLWIIAGLTLLIAAGAFAYRVFEKELLRWAMVPTGEFRPVAMPDGADYADAALWIARPDIADNPAGWTPPGVAPAGRPRVAVFFVHPTSFLEASAWNAPVDESDSQRRAALFVRSPASAFNQVGAIWAPKYRQTAFGAFLTDEANAGRALDFAYRDVAAAYETFLQQAPPDAPIILAGHSQGSLHLMRLLQERVRGAPEAARIVAAYLGGWPVSVTADLPALPLPACERADQPRCLLAWQSFAEPAEPSMVTDAYDASVGPGGVSRAGTAMVCVNPLTGSQGGAAGPAANRGTLIPNEDFSEAEFRPRAVGARCDLRGFLLIGEEDSLPDMGRYVLPGNNYHVYDYALFWANLRADAERRVAAFLRTRRR